MADELNENIDIKEREQLLFEISFYKNLLKQLPGYIEALIPLGNAYTKLGMYYQGLEIDEKLIKIRPDDPLVWYNYTCSLSLLERVEEAFTALNRAVSLGYIDFDFMDNDPDLTNLRKDKRYQQLKKSKKFAGKGNKAAK